MIGFNFRMTEIEAAIAFEQLDLLDEVVKEKQRRARILDRYSVRSLANRAGYPSHESAYYVYPVRLDVARIPAAERG